MRLKVAQVNAYNGNRLRRLLRLRLAATRADVIMCCEAQRLGSIAGYRRLAADSGSHGRRELAIYVRRGIKVAYWFMLKASDDTGRGVSHDRWILVGRLRINGEPVTAIATHYNAAIHDHASGRVKDSRGAREATEHGEVLAGVIREELGAGRTVVCGADFNWPIRTDGWSASPAALTKRFGMGLVGRGIDGLLYDRKRWALVRSRIIRLPGSDHPGVVAVLRKRKP